MRDGARKTAPSIVGEARTTALATLGLALTTAFSPGCGRSHASSDAVGQTNPGTLVTVPSAVAPGAARPGMVWIRAGVLRAGSPLEDVPRVADAEPPDVETPLDGFYIDRLPWPNEPGAIATTNVTRDEARRLCQDKGKRLCSELEWERACKGPDNTRFEYGPVYDARTCGAGMVADVASRKPIGQRQACRSAFAVSDMHGGAAEWTDSRWGRGLVAELGVVRGGNDVSGELVTRCAYARPLAPGERSAATGFRCCAGPRNDDEVVLEVKRGPYLEERPKATEPSPPLEALSGVACGPPATPKPCSIARAWTWRPAPNVELSLSGGCVGRDPHARCGIGVSRRLPDRVQTVAQIDTGLSIPEVVLVDKSDHRVRVRGGDFHGYFFRELLFRYGQIEIKEVH